MLRLIGLATVCYLAWRWKRQSGSALGSGMAHPPQHAVNTWEGEGGALPTQELKTPA